MQERETFNQVEMMDIDDFGLAKLSRREYTGEELQMVDFRDSVNCIMGGWIPYTLHRPKNHD
jgi:hypothetical protein